MKNKAEISTFFAILVGVLIVIAFYFLVNSNIDFNKISKKIPGFKRPTSSQEINGTRNGETTTQETPPQVTEPTLYQRQDISFFEVCF